MGVPSGGVSRRRYMVDVIPSRPVMKGKIMDDNEVNDGEVTVVARSRSSATSRMLSPP